MLFLFSQKSITILFMVVSPMSINGSEVRDTVRVLKVVINTVIGVLKKSSIKNNKSFINTPEVIIAPEIDEQWSYVQNKSKQRWLWYD